MTTKRFPPVELIQANHPFPGPYTFKVIGQAEGDFINRVLEAVEAAVGPHIKPRHSHRETSGGKHVAVTLEITLESAQHVILVYEKLVVVQGAVLVL